MKNITCIALIWIALVSTTQAAGFDCQRAATQVEKMICDTQKVSLADEHLKNIYDQLLKLAPNPRWVKTQQRDWLVNTRNTCTNTSCLESEYGNRIAMLEVDLQSMGAKDDAKVCDAIVGFINRGTLGTLETPSSETLPTPEIISSIFWNSEGVDQPYRYWAVDLNNDGVLDHLLMTDEGRIHSHQAYAVSGSKNAAVANLDYEEADAVEVLSLGGRHYVYTTKLWDLGKNGKFRQRCAFAYTGKSKLGIGFGKHNPVCAEIKAAMHMENPNMVVLSDGEGEFKRLVFDKSHKLKQLPEEERSIVDGLAQADIDNDGQQDNVVRIESEYKGALPCSATTIAITDKAATSIPDTKTNKVLLEEIGGYRCSSSLEAIVHRGVTYIHMLDSSNAFYRIKNGKAEMICSFQTNHKYRAETVLENP